MLLYFDHMQPGDQQIQMAQEECTVPAALAGVRLDKAAAELFADYSRVELRRWIDNGELVVDGQPSKPRHKLKGGEVLALHGQRTIKALWDTAEPMVLDVLYEDEDVLVLNKPAGLVVHPGAGNAAGTLVNGLLAYRPQQAQLARAGVVHRLDKDTSGLMVVATSHAGQHGLTSAIAARQVNREYLGICEGRMIGGRDVDAPIGRDPHVRTRQAVREDGKPAFTSFRVRERFAAHTLVAAKLGSGRTHQIRVHLRSIGFSLVGDKRYGARGILPPASSTELIEALRGFSRQALHAWRLGFDHPVSGEPLEFVQEPPADMTALTGLLAEHSAAQDGTL